MNKIMKRILFTLLIFILMFSVKSNAEENITVTIETSQTQIFSGDEVNVKVNIENEVQPTSIVVIEFYYSKAVFEEVEDTDFEKIGRWNYPEIGIIEDEDTEEESEYYYYRAMIDRNADVTSIGTILDFNLKVKEEVTTFEGARLGISYIEMTDKNATSITKEEKNVIKTFTNPGYLYFETEKYKIGEENTTTYKKGDEYISRVPANTTIEEFLLNIITNGEIKLYDIDGISEIEIEENTTETEEIEENTSDIEENTTKIVKTGMKIQVTKEGHEDINLIIVVIGDIDENGKISSTDLAALKQGIQKEIVLEGVQYKAADISEDDKLSATDLAAMIQFILQELVV